MTHAAGNAMASQKATIAAKRTDCFRPAALATRATLHFTSAAKVATSSANVAQGETRTRPQQPHEASPQSDL